jgi:hypothetical protein
MTTPRPRIISALARAARALFARGGGPTVIVESIEVRDGGTGLSFSSQSAGASSIRKILSVVFLSVLAVPIFVTCRGAWQTWDERRETELLKRLQREAEHINGRLDAAARRERDRVGLDSAENGDHEYRAEDGECLGKDSWEHGRLLRRVLYRAGQTGRCEEQLASERYFYQSDDRSRRDWRQARKKIRTYPNDSRRIVLLDEFTATGLLNRKEHCREGFKGAVEKLECDRSVSLEDQMRSPLPAQFIMVPSPVGVPPIPLYR